MDWRADEVNTRRLDALGKEAHGVGPFFSGGNHTQGQKDTNYIEFIRVFFSMFCKLGVKIFRDALDWLSLDDSFITVNVSFFVVNSSKQFFHQFSVQLRCVCLNV